MKKFLFVALVAVATVFPAFKVQGCEITVSVDGARKPKYESGEILVIDVKVVLEHRRCSVDINETTINVAGMEIVGATKWVNTGGNTWVRKVKVKIGNSKDHRATLVAERTCTKDGGKGSLTLDI